MKSYRIRIKTIENARKFTVDEEVEKENILSCIVNHLAYLGYTNPKEPNSKSDIVNVNEMVLNLIADGVYIYDNENLEQPLYIEVEIINRIPTL
jgi:hypothetical protein